MRRSLFFPTKHSSHQKGFSLVEIIVGSAVFALVAVSVYQSYGTLLSLVSASRVKITATDLINEQFELVRNLPYSSVGIISGLPAGVLDNSENILRDGNTYAVTRIVRNIDDPFDGTIASSTNRDLSPADYKLVDITIECPTCKNFQPMVAVTRVSPKGLETASTNGALFIKVFDANGQPIKDADVHIENRQGTTTIIIDDVTDAQGLLQIIDAPPGNLAYEISVSKPGYSSDQTYGTSTGNPTPIKPSATVVRQQVTQISFSIDMVSTMNVSTVDPTCGPIASVPFSLTGAKLIGSNPIVYKYNQTFTTDVSGTKDISPLEWDTYAMTITSLTYRLSGVNPLLPVSVAPNSTQNVQLVLNTFSPAQLLVTVKDSVGLPLSGATVDVSISNSTTTRVTGRGFFSQTDWSGGPGQATYSNVTQYDVSDGNIDTNSPIGEMKLNRVVTNYAPSGDLTSSVFDTGTASNFSQISWAPSSQPAQSGANTVRFQFASAPANTSTTTWNFLGPDGTAGTYYSTSNTNISAVHGGDRYFKYKTYLQTASSTSTPNISDVAVTLTSSCTPPGQALFYGLTNGTATVTVNLAGYSQSQVQVSIPTNSSYVQQGVTMIP